MTILLMFKYFCEDVDKTEKKIRVVKKFLIVKKSFVKILPKI